MERIIANREIYLILAMYLLVQFAVLILAYFAPHNVSTLTVSGIAQGAGIPSWEIALGYAAWIAIAGTAMWYVIRNLKYRDTIIKIAEALFIIGGTGCIFLLFFSQYGYLCYVPGVFLVYFKHMIPSLRNFACMVASVGVALLLASQFGFIILVILMALIAIYDYIAVRITKHMVAMAQAYGNLNLALMVTVFRRTGKDTFSSLTLGGGDLIFPAAVSSAVVFAVPGAITLSLAMCITVGGLLALGLLIGEIRRTGKPYPAIPYLMGGMAIGFMAFLIGVLI